MKKIFIYSFIWLSITLFSHQSFAQMYHANHFMQSIPQASFGNPALMPDMNAYVGLFSTYLTFGHTGFAPRDLLRLGNNGLYWDQDNLIKKLSSQNLLRTDLNLDILGFGWRKGRNYYTFNVTPKVNAYFGYPGDFLTIALKGNDYFENRPASFSGFGLDAQAYLETGIGFAREFTDELTIGIKAKYLRGVSALWFEKNNLSLNTDPQTYALTFEADFLLHKSAPIMLGPFDSLTSGSGIQTDIDWVDWATKVNNPGFAFDIGASYKISDRFMVAASVIDLGRIIWKDNTESYTSKGEFEFSGFEIKDLFKDKQFNAEFVENLTDSIIKIFDVTDGQDAFTRYLSPKFFASAVFTLTPKRRAGVLFRGEMYKGQFYPGFTISYNRKLLQGFSTTLTYSYMNNNFYNVGAGFNMNLGPLQVFVVGDNFLAALLPETFQTFSIHAGANLVFGYRKKKVDPARPLHRW